MKPCSCLLCSLLAYNVIVHLSTPKRYTLYYNHKDDSSVYTASRLSPLSQDELTSAVSESDITIPRKLCCLITYYALSPLVQAELNFGILTSVY